MKFLDVPSAVVPTSSFALQSKCPVRAVKALIVRVIAALVFVSGEACNAQASINPSTLIWSVVALGNTSGSKIATLTNNGSAAITIKSVAIGGTNPTDFLISAKTCGSSLTASASCTVTIRFKPTTTGVRKAILTISDTASNNPQSIALSGTGIPASSNITVSPSSLSWLSVTIGNLGGSKSIALTNAGPNSITFTSIKVGGTNAGDFIISTNTCGSSLAASASCSVGIRFKPLAAGNRVGTLTLSNSAANRPQVVSLSGIRSAPTSGALLLALQTYLLGISTLARKVSRYLSL